MVINKQFPRCIRQILFAIIALFEIYVGHINEVTGIQNHLIHMTFNFMTQSYFITENFKIVN